MALQQLSSQPTAGRPLHPLLGYTQQNELAADNLRNVEREQYRAARHNWLGLYQYEQRQAETAAVEAEKKAREAEATRNEEMNQRLAGYLNSRVPCVNQERMEGGIKALKPLTSSITGEVISVFPTTLEDLDTLDESEVHRILWHLGITKHIRASEEEETFEDYRREYALWEKRGWIRIRWVGIVRRRRTLRDCFPPAREEND